MIRIIKQGILPTKIKKRIIYKRLCAECGCIFEFEAEDMLERAKTLNFQGTIDCPFCHTRLNISSFNISKREEEITEDETNS